MTPTRPHQSFIDKPHAVYRLVDGEYVGWSWDPSASQWTPLGARPFAECEDEAQRDGIFAAFPARPAQS
jgi:hypothetical protein